MPLMDRIKRWYAVKMVCDNCGKDCEIRIKKGVSVNAAVKGRDVMCDNCGCTIQAKEYRTQWLK